MCFTGTENNFNYTTRDFASRSKNIIYSETVNKEH